MAAGRAYNISLAAQSLPLSIEEFHRLYQGAKPAYEYWDGEAVQKSMPPTVQGIVQFLLMRMLDDAGWNAASEVRLKVVANAEPVPDFIAVQGKFEGRYPTVAPALCAEILSTGDSLSAAFQKAAKYLAWGTEYVWIINPDQRSAWSLSRNAPEPVLVSSTGALRLAETTIEMSALWAGVDRRLERFEEQA